MEHQSNDQHIRGSLNPALRNPLLLVVILVVLTESGFRFSLNISQLLAKAIPVRGAIFREARSGKPERAFCCWALGMGGYEQRAEVYI
ncbi:hypothetical protein [Serratia marcescens]|uniref:hypothetical protein n=1 Tax=Serratia marcescens TaxID=615 RepID=UPI001F4053F8|nr:hypothetical protein [Serratia marcescens]MCF1217355.1 hypothetical protein [Serratia marcescens]MCF1319879.1 hypothetical protein [Serratia marcescens]MCF1324633.1 hypothetical protein [Serratia marcescens]MDV5426516.1 hypothetical protein [Serratia marcescens]MDV5707815.1 hypothetical protein [Serratia marcescens]